LMRCELRRVKRSALLALARTPDAGWCSPASAAAKIDCRHSGGAGSFATVLTRSSIRSRSPSN
jgi:hypothetical protein